MEISKLKNEYQMGKSLTQIAKDNNISRWKLTKLLKDSGENIINKHNLLKFNENYFDVIDTEEKAYWLGFIFADGCIMSKTYSFELSLSHKDKDHVKKFANAINYSGKIYTKKHSVTCCLRSKHFWEKLYNCGCIPNKSLILKFPQTNIFKSKSLIKDFIKGYFDGDGCISQHTYTHTVSPYVSVIGTKDFLKEILNYCNLQAKFKHDARHANNTFSLEFSKENGIKFINYIYSNSTIHLDRKYNKFLFFKNGSRPIQEWIGLLSGKIGESPIQDNPEVNIEIKKSISPYSVDNETSNRI